jgi:hypothetical protein
MNFKRRVGRLEKEFNVAKEIVLWRVVISNVGKTVDLATSTCTRTLWNRQLSETIHLDGHPDTITDEEFEQFVESFPILDSEGRVVTLPDSARVIRK